MPAGFMGKVLWVDLSTGAINEEQIAEEVYRQFLSGLGLAAYLLYREIPPQADPLGPNNVLGFVSGLLSGTNSLFTGRWMAVARSPLTGAWGEANCGGTLAPAIKRCGYDGIFFKGVSPRPVYLVINGKPELRDAANIWGADTVETDTRLRKLHPNSAVACIGPAGEMCSLLAGIANDAGRLAARSGLGAVMGAKKLKAVVLHGQEKIQVHDKAQMQRLSQECYHHVRFNVPLPPGKIMKFAGTLMRILPLQIAQDGMLYQWILQRWGTIGMNQVSVEMGDAPIQNWKGSNKTFAFRRSESSNPDGVIQWETQKYHCRSCALGCGGMISNEVVRESHKPEYETMLSWGGLMLNEDQESIMKINDRLNRAGMDSISAGGTVAFAIECAEEGLFSAETLDGLDLRWGNSQAILELVERIITRQGIGDLLADGSRKAAAKIGKQAGQYAVHAGGQELAMHDGRNDPGFSLHAVVEPMPGRHTNGSQLYYEMFQLWTRLPNFPRPTRLYSKDKKYQVTDDLAVAAVACSRFSQVLNGAGVCLFGAFLGVHRVPIFEWLNAATGWTDTPQEYMQTGARIQALKQLFNVRHRVSLRHAINPRALGQPPLDHGANQGRTLDMDGMVRAYWSAAGWESDTGLPSRKTLTSLGLDSLVNIPESTLP